MKVSNSSTNTPVRQDKPFDPETYVDPYGTTTCYPSDHERVMRQREERMRKYGTSESATKKKYHYKITISNASEKWRTFEKQELINGDIRLKNKSKDISYLNGTYIWDSDIYLPDEDAMFDYIYSHYDVMKRYKVDAVKNIYDVYNDNLDAYLEDPEDESEFNPDIYDYLID